MSKISICLFFVFFATAIYCSPTPDGHSKPGYCHIDGLDIKEGETVPAPIGKCQNYNCHHAEHNHVGSLTCPAFVLPPDSKCHVVGRNLTKPYPQCCEHPVCPDHE